MDDVTSETSRGDLPANDALLAQLVRGALGRQGRGTSGINVSSCSFVVTLHGTVGSMGESERVEEVARAVPGVEDVTNRLKVK
jgi:osmotically-inducible protein OsmY